MTDTRLLLETRSLTVGYGERIVASAVDAAIKAGELLVLLGPNGSGKTTLLKTIAGQLAPLHGAVFLAGKDLNTVSGSDRSKKLSLLSTERPAGELMTCREVVSAGRYPYTGRLGILSDRDREVAERCMERMGALELAETPFDSISDGQRQRVLLARALCQEPEVLVLDEPASYLDIRYQLELVEALKRLSREDGLAVVVSLHELDLARRCGGRILCLREGRVDRLGTAEEIFAGDYLEKLFSLPAGSLQNTGAPEGFSHYVQSEGKRLRCGYTTGTCAALAASGAARALLTGAFPESVSLVTPKGIRVEVPLEACEQDETRAACGVRKDAGDDVDCTAGALICAEVRFRQKPGVEIDGGAGVGRVTKPGLDQPVGAAAINSTPRRMILEAVEAVCRTVEYDGGLQVTVSVPQGEELAKKTLNGDLGVLGGISILGTSGIVEPMSHQALVDTIALELRQAYALGHRRVILTPGNYGTAFLREQGLDAFGVPVVKCSNYIGDALDEAVSLGYEELLLAGHLGKLIKLAGGIMNTHSRQADCRRELITAHAAVCGGSRELCQALMECATTDACLELLEREGRMEQVMESLIGEIGKHLQKRAQGIQAGAMVFSNERGLLGVTPEAKTMTDRWRMAAGEGK